MKALVIPEDFRHDQYILKPLAEKMLERIGYAKPKVRVCTDPLLGSVSKALNQTELQTIIDRYPMLDLFILVVDRDGDPGRAQRLDQLEQDLSLAGHQRLVAENAWQEVEVWLLAGHSLPKDWNWKAVRDERDPKEKYYEPFARAQGAWEGLGQGRKRLGDAAAKNYDRVRRLCPDVQQLEERLQDPKKARAI